MALIRLEEITKHFGDLLLFDSISFSINKGEKIALVAQNGTGKSTLISLIMGKDVPQEGSIEIHPNIRIGLLEQTPTLESHKTIYNEVFDSHTVLLDARKKYNEAIASGSNKNIQKYTDIIDQLDAWDYESKVDHMISLMKLPDAHTPISQLSGGQKKRVALAKLLLQKPDLLILDEPTNHLDIEIIEWLEGFLSASNLTLLMVTHDRYFLDRVCSTIIELAEGKTHTYQGNYSYYLEKKEERESIQRAEINKAKNLLRTELNWIRRQPKARGTKAKYRVDAFSDLQAKAQNSIQEKEVDISVASKRLGNKIIEIKNLSKAYGEHVLFTDFSHLFYKQEKVGILGENGCGKTTLLQTITGELLADSGSIDYGETLEIGYYKQDGLQVSNSKKVIEVITDIAERIQITKKQEMSATQYLEHWLFPRSMHYLHVEKLSGGEKKRLYLMTVLMKQPNFLILDEPTNDLDLSTLQILEDYLANFQGCVVIVSHDRFFTDKVVDHLFVFETDGHIRDFPGNYSLYREFIEYQKEIAQQNSSGTKKNTILEIKKNKKGLTYKERLELESVEKELAELEAQKEAITNTMHSGSLSSEELMALSEQIGKIISRIESLETRWVELSEKAEE